METNIIDATGSPHDLGLVHGNVAATLIRESSVSWRAAMTTAGHDPDELVAALAQQSGFGDAVEQHVPWLMAEVQGIASGSGLSLDEVFALNCLDEAWWWGDAPPGCSTVGTAWPEERRALCGQNMDLDTWMDGSQVVLRGDPADRPGHIVLSRAGMVGLCGVNNQGVAVLVNTLPQLPVSKSGVPVAFVLRAALAAENVDEAEAILRGLPHASGQAYTLTSVDKVVGLECGADGTFEYVNSPTQRTRRWHTNHPLAADGDGSVEPDSAARMQVLDSNIENIDKVDDVQRLLADGDSGVCMYPGRWPGDWMTFGSIAVSINDTIRATFTFGPPDRNPWFEVSF